jgi:replicative superfamily II helicase
LIGNKLKISNQIMDLVRFSLPESICQMWRQNIGTELLPLQVTAINDYGILDGESVFISAPTSSGKTFIGELAAVKNMMNTRKVVFLLPYRALVNEKFEKFTEMYQDEFNIKVIRCSGDYLDQTKEFLRSEYDIAFLTYEMFLALVVNHSNILGETGLIVIDEAQFIGNDNRGIVVELILTHLRIASQEGFKPQLLLLSATVGDINHFNDWLGVTYLCTKERPVPLEFGVVDGTGIFQFKDKNGNLKKKQLFDHYTIHQHGREPGSQDYIAPICKALMKGNEDVKILIFRNTRRAAEGCAKYLSKELGLDSAGEEVLDQLPALDVSSTGQTLKECSRGGTAFHNSNLTREQRSAVEISFRDPDGKLRVLVSTSTLAAGVNTPASYVIIVEHAYPWEDREYTVGEVQNMAGRAGRLGFQETGTAIMIAGSSIQRRNLFDKYVEAVPDPISSSFKEDDLGTWIIKLLSQVKQIDTSELPKLLSNTFGGYLRNRKDHGWCKNISQKISDVFDVLLENELIEQNGDHLKLTLLGSACGQSSFSLPSSLKLLELFNRYNKKRMLTPMELAALIQSIPELDSQYVPLNKKGNSEAKWPQIANSFVDNSIISLLRLNVRSYHNFYARCKKICIIQEWIDGTPIDSIEANFTTNPYFPLGFGDVRAIADSTRFHLRSASNILSLYSPFNCPEPDSISNFLKQVELGIPRIALDLLNLPVQLERGEYLALVSKGITTTEQFLSPKRFKVVKKMIRPGLLAKIL